MPTQCSQKELDFGSCGERKLVGAFDGGAIDVEWRCAIC